MLKIQKILLVTFAFIISGNLLFAEGKRMSFSHMVNPPANYRAKKFNDDLRNNIIPMDLIERLNAFKNLDKNIERDIILAATGFPQVYETIPISQEGYIQECFDDGSYLGVVHTDSLANARIYFAPKCATAKAFWRSSANADSCHIVAEYKVFWGNNDIALLWEKGTAGFLVISYGHILGEMVYLNGEFFFVNSTSRDIKRPYFIEMTTEKFNTLRDTITKYGDQIVKFYYSVVEEEKKKILESQGIIKAEK